MTSQNPDIAWKTSEQFADEVATTLLERLQVDSPFRNAFEPGHSETIEYGIGEKETFGEEAYGEAHVHADRVVEPELEEKAYWRAGDSQEGPYLDENPLVFEESLRDNAQHESPEAGFETERIDAPTDVPEAIAEEVKSFDEPEVEEREAELALSASEAFEQQTAGVKRVTFPSGEPLFVVPGPTGEGQEHHDPNNTANPLLDTSGANRSKRLSRNFTVDELASSGGKRFDKARIDPHLVACLQAIRERIGKPVAITSAYRPYIYNVQIYQGRGQESTKSRHSSGQAADIKVEGMTGLELSKVAIDVCGCSLGVGIGANYIHIDVRGRWARWTYLRDKPASSRVIQDIDTYRRRKCSDNRVPTGPANLVATELPPASTLGLRRRIVDVANREWERWGRGAKKETNPDMRAVLKEYWMKAKIPPEQAEQRIDRRDPWSAAFISWVMNQAGAGSAFAYNPAHQYYIAAAKRNKEEGNQANPFWAHHISAVAPAVGDLVCACRANSGATYDNIENGYRAAHCDIVTEVQRNRIAVIGGNVSDSVGKKTMRTDDRGLVIPAASPCTVFAVIKVRDLSTGLPTASTPIRIQSAHFPSGLGPNRTARIDVARAIRLNQHYSQQLGWNRHFDQIVRLLGFTVYSPDEETFARAVASWQLSHGLGVDGIIGPNSWRKLQSALGISVSAASSNTHSP